jgi:hypothetical protein
VAMITISSDSAPTLPSRVRVISKRLSPPVRPF